MNQTVHLDVFTHVRLITGFITSLSIARLLTGLARFVQHPKRETIYPVHFGWALFLLLYTIYFWWFQIMLVRIDVITFEFYVYILSYIILLFFLSTLLFPDRLDEYKGFEDYFTSRQKWFYGLLALVFLFDVFDSVLKGWDHFWSLSEEYMLQQTAFFTLAVVAMFVRRRNFHLMFVAGALIVQIVWILRHYNVMA